MTLNWLQQQRLTPSFSSSTGGEHTFSALDQALPASLKEFGDSGNASQQLFSSFNDASHRLGTERRSRSVLGDRSTSRARSVGSACVSSVVDQKRTSRHIDVFESLYERGKLEAVAKEKMRIEAEQEKLKRCRSVPKINRINDDNVMPPTTSIFQRLYNKEHERQRDHQNKITNMQIKEEKWLSTLFTPRISHKGHRSKGTTGSATTSEKYSFKTLQRMEELRKEKIMKEMEMMMETPDINQKSRLLAQKQREREGLVGYSHIEAMLERDRISKLMRYEQRERELIAQNPGTPRITEYAASIRNHESANERLYRSAQRARTPGPNDIQASNTSKNEKMNKSEGSFAEFSNLARHDQETRARRDERLRRIMEDEQAPHTPSINPVSASIAARLPTTTEDRLTATPKRSATSLSSGSAIHVGEQKVEKKEAPSARDLQLFERLRIAEARRKIRVEAARSELEQRREEECTFSPITTTSYYPPNRTQGDLYHRSHQWLSVRDEKLRRQKESEVEAEVHDCTFQPAVSRKTQAIYENGGLESGFNSADVAGFENFVSRQKKTKVSSESFSDSTTLNKNSWDGSIAVSKEIKKEAPPNIPQKNTLKSPFDEIHESSRSNLSTSIYSRR